jgi:hypothetical protein
MYVMYINIIHIHIGQLLAVSHGDVIYVWEIPDLNIDDTNNNQNAKINENENYSHIIAPKLHYYLDLLDYKFDNKFIIKSVLWHSISLPTLIVFSIVNNPIKLVLPRRYIYICLYICIWIYM